MLFEYICYLSMYVFSVLLLFEFVYYLSTYVIGERAKRLRRYLVMFMETRDI